MKPHLVLLPGLDGTGLLLDEIAAELSGSFRVTILRYPETVLLGYDGLLEFLRASLPPEVDCLVGESFSGPLALRIAAERPKQIRSVVLVASFARLDLPFRRVLAGLTAIVPASVVPMRVLSWLLIGQGATPDLRHRLRTALARVAPRILALRMREALAADPIAAGSRVEQPLLYLRAKADRLMPRSAADGVARVAASFETRAIDGPHFLLQIATAACAREIRAFHETVRPGSRMPGASPHDVGSPHR